MVKTTSSDQDSQVRFIVSYVFQIYCKAKTINNNSGNTFPPELSVFHSKLHTEPNQAVLLFDARWWTSVIG